MIRFMPVLAVGLATLMLAAPGLGADYSNSGGFDAGESSGLRSGFASDWDNTDTGSPLSFELGLRYFYSWGAQSFTLNSTLATDVHGAMKESDQSQAAEAHFRIDDASTKTYVKGLGGMAFQTTGTATDSTGTSAVSNGKIQYLGADIGYSLLGDAKSGATFGPFAGYMYWNDSPNTYSDNYAAVSSAADVSYDQSNGQTSFAGSSSPNDINLNMLRLGLSGKANLGPMFDISGEVAAVPYARITGVLGAGSGMSTGGLVSYDNQSSVGPHGLTGAYNIHDIQSSPTSIDGWGYGAMGEAMFGFHPTSNLAIRLGGRAWYVQGTADATFSRASIGDPTDSVQPVAGTPADPTTTPPTPAVPPQLNSPNFDTAPSFSNQTYITRANPFSLFRYGVLAELTYSF